MRAGSDTSTATYCAFRGHLPLSASQSPFDCHGYLCVQLPVAQKVPNTLRLAGPEKIPLSCLSVGRPGSPGTEGK